MNDHDFPMIKGQGPNCHVTYHSAVTIDPWLRNFGDWLDHDGKGVPDFLLGRRIRIAGIDHQRECGLSSTTPFVVTPEYVSSVEAEVWDWSLGYGGVSGYRVERNEPLPLCDEAIRTLDILRGGMGRNGSRPLLLGMDGAPE